MAAYATGQDLCKRRDVALVGDLATDGREPVENSLVPNHPNVITALEDASGEVDVALTVGGQYTPSQLTSLTGNSRSHLVRIVCDIAFNLLILRRSGEQHEDLAEKVSKQAREHLQALRRGENVFGLPEHQAASTINIETVSSVEIDQLNLLPSRMSPYFPNSAQRVSRYP
jgi:phage gp36-like protein